MKFAKALERDLVPEWRVKYFNYKAGKRHVKNATRALQAAQEAARGGPAGSPRTSGGAGGAGAGFLSFSPRGGGGSGGRSWAGHGGEPEEVESLSASPAPPGRARSRATRSHGVEGAAPGSANVTPRPTPASAGGAEGGDGRGSFSLPAPALRVPSIQPCGGSEITTGPPTTTATAAATATGLLIPPLPARHWSSTAPAAAATPVLSLTRPDPHSEPPSPARQLRPSAHPAAPMSPGIRSLHTIISSSLHHRRHGLKRGADEDGAAAAAAAASLDAFRDRERDLFDFMDRELAKIEAFYRLKEDQAGQRLMLLEGQLREMRDRRTGEIVEARRQREAFRVTAAAAAAAADTADTAAAADAAGGGGVYQTDGADSQHQQSGSPRATTSIMASVIALARTRLLFGPGPNSTSLQSMPRTPQIRPASNNNNNPADAARDYTRRLRRRRARPVANNDGGEDQAHESADENDDKVSYSTAKHKLKLALQEFHRSLELLKSYALLNRTAFRKLNKKYIKAVGVRGSTRDRYMSRKVDRAWFVRSEVLDRHITAVEELYARFFEAGNRKVAVSKLRGATVNGQSAEPDMSDKAFWTGLMVGAGCLFAAEALKQSARLLRGEGGGGDGDGDGGDDGGEIGVSLTTSYLLQLYAGYFLILALLGIFCLDCKVWTSSRVNYPFIFEFDPRNRLDWRELSLFSSFFFLLLSLVMWINFAVLRYGDGTSLSSALFTYCPVILVGLTVCIILLPAPILAYKSRRWLVCSHGRLLVAGLYPVEFRDFFLGDMYCSLSYSTANLEMFFCLYGHHWHEPDQCNSNTSRLLGFCAALPPIWRLLQCIRRFRDTGNVFPHLVNCAKYGMTIAATVGLSLYRISGSEANLAAYATLATANAIYCSVWDLLMDFSLLQPQSRNRWLRDILALRHRWLYYAIVMIDPILRFCWIPYVIFTHRPQHSSVVSFAISLAEVCRRGLWVLIRVENEHCANVAVHRASRDVPLPYRLELFIDEREHEHEHVHVHENGSSVGERLSPSQPRRPGATPMASPAAPTAASSATSPPRPGRLLSSGACSIIGIPSWDSADEHQQQSRRSREATGADRDAEAATHVTTPVIRADGLVDHHNHEDGVGRGGDHRARMPYTRTVSRIMAEAHRQDFERRRTGDFEEKFRTARRARGGNDGDDADSLSEEDEADQMDEADGVDEVDEEAGYGHDDEPSDETHGAVVAHDDVGDVVASPAAPVPTSPRIRGGNFGVLAQVREEETDHEGGGSGGLGGTAAGVG